MYLLQDLRDLNSLSRLGCVLSVICVCWSDVEGDRKVIFCHVHCKGGTVVLLGDKKVISGTIAD